MLLILFFICLNVVNLNGRSLRQARNVNGLNVNAYLEKFGYMPKSDAGSGILNTPITQENGLKKFQSWNKLPVTGELDEETVKLMNTPRCGVKDPEIPAGMSRSFVLGPKWSRKSLTYRIVKTTPDLSAAVVRSELKRALKFWSDVADLQFTETSSSSDIVIDFFNGDHGDGDAFDGSGGVLAHAFFPEGGACHFDEGEQWVANQTGIDLFIVAAHEFGHILGLDHSNVRSALMYPFYSGYVPNYSIDADDRAAIIAHYGAAPVVTGAPTVAPAPTSGPEPGATTNMPAEACNNTFTASLQLPTGEILAFVNKRDVYSINETSGVLSVQKAAARYPDVPYRPDGAFVERVSGKTFFIRGRLFYEYSSSGALTSRTWIPGGSTAMPEQARAAFVIDANEAYVFGSTRVWKMNLNTRTVVSGSHMNINTRFPGIPNDVTSALTNDGNVIHIFKDSNFYTFNMGTNRVVEGPLPVTSRFLRTSCPTMLV